jgi:2-methylcitrate dehydratase PrpD
MESFKSYQSALIQVARAAESGVFASTLAQQGVHGSSTIIEGGGLFSKGGFASAFADNYNLDVITKDLGDSYAISETGIKIHDGCRHSHASIDAVMELTKKYGIKSDDIQEVIIKTYSLALDLQSSTLRTATDAKFSIPFAVAMVVLEGELTPDKFSIQKIQDKNIRQFMKKVKVKFDPEIEAEYPKKWGANVEILTTDEKYYRQRVDFAKGEPENPFSHEEIEEKFRRLTRGILKSGTADEIIELVDSIESVKHINRLTDLLVC